MWTLFYLKLLSYSSKYDEILEMPGSLDIVLCAIIENHRSKTNKTEKFYFIHNSKTSKN